MKTSIKRTAFLLVLIFSVITGNAQVPQGFNYQAVIRNSSGTPLGDQNVKIHVLLTNSLGTVVYYEEVHALTTSNQGVANLTIGEGTLKQGTLDAAPWKDGDVYLKIEVDPTGGNSYQTLGSPVKFYSVPYALYADNTKEVVSQPNAVDTDPIFVVKNKLGQTVFAVFQTGVRVYVADTTSIKGAKGGFAVGGLTSKSISDAQDYLSITPSGTRIWFDNRAKGAKGGFAVGGLTGQGKVTTPTEYLSITDDSSRFYIKDLGKGAKGGFAVGGLTGQGKAVPKNFLSISPDSTRIYVSNQALSNSSSLGGFSIKSAENTSADYFNISALATAKRIINESRVMWYPSKSSLLAGEISVPHPDSVGQYSMALGYRNMAKGSYSQAMGYESVARGDFSTAIGYQAIAGNNSFSFGSGSKALGLGSFAFGAKGVDVTGNVLDVSTEATGNFSFAFGLGSKAKALGSFVLGVNCESSAKFAIATGFGSMATGANATAMGLNTEASGIGSFASGNNCKATGLNSTAMGVNNESSGPVSFTMGSGNMAIAQYAFAFGANNNANGQSSLAFGQGNTASGLYSIVGGYQNVASGSFSFAVGSSNNAIGDGSMAVGTSNNCGGVASAAFGDGNSSSGANSFVAGYHTKATNQNSFAIGNTTQAINDNAIAFGDSTNSRGYCSVASGYHVTAKAYASMVLGRYNTVLGNSGSWVGTDPIFVIGNGTSTALRNDALVIYKNGSVKVDGNLYPNDASGTYLGSVTNKWEAIYAINSVIQTSDARLKKDITNLNYGLKDILKLRPVSFTWKEGTDQRIKLGLIAQEVQPIINEVVDVGDDQNKTLGINYSSLIPVLIKSIQDQQTIIEEQKAKNTELENQLIQISKKLEELEKRIK